MSNAKTVNLWDLLGSRETMTSVSDGVIAKATGKDAVKAETAKALADVREALKNAETPEAFAEVVTKVRETYGTHTDMVRMGEVLGAAVKVSAAIRRTIIREAFTRGLVGTGKQYPTQAALAASVGVSGAYVTQNKPTPKNADKVKAGKVSAEVKADAKADTGTDGQAPTGSLAALQQALTRLESASGKAFTPEEYADVLRVANALDTIAKNLRLVAKDAKTA